MAFNNSEVGFVGSGQIPGNGYMFRCPVVERDAAFSICVARRNKHWRGEQTQAQDCHVAMCGGKCPAVHMMQMEYGEGEPLFFDNTVRMHALPKAIIERIERVILVPYWAAGYALTAEQQILLFGGIREIPKTVEKVVKVSRKRLAKASEAEADDGDLTAGLETVMTDMSGLVNLAMGTAA